MSFFNVLSALGFPTDQNAGIVLHDADGKKYELYASDTYDAVKFGTGGSNAYWRLGTPESVTIASGVATVTQPFVKLAAESSTSDQLDSIVYSGVQQGDLLLLCADTGDTITVDDANIDLTGTTIALAGPSQFLLLIYNGAGWSEVSNGLGDNA